MYPSSTKFQSFIGPSDPTLRRSEIEGYQPVSRIGEIVVNAFGTPGPRFAWAQRLTRLSARQSMATSSPPSTSTSTASR